MTDLAYFPVCYECPRCKAYGRNLSIEAIRDITIVTCSFCREQYEVRLGQDEFGLWWIWYLLPHIPIVRFRYDRYTAAMGE